MAGCHKTPAQNVAASSIDQNAGDPANANMAPVDGNGSYVPSQAAQPARVLGQNAQYQTQQQGEDYPQQQGAPIERRAPYSADQSNGDQNYNTDLNDQQAADLYASDLADTEANDPPPPLPYYEQPPAPDPDYLWTPGYWAWGPGDYYWVPGCWVAAPYTGALWTPGYWGFYSGRYRFHHGFWGLHIGFYGGVDYGYGYVGHGYYGGYWDHDHFRYNTAVSRVNVNVIRNVYVHNVVINNVVVNNRITNNVSFNGGRGGLQTRPVAAEIAVFHEQRHAPMASQVQVQREASQNRQQFYTQNQGRPAIAVSARPVVADRSAAVLPRVALPVPQPGARNDARPGQTQNFGRSGQQDQVPGRQGPGQQPPQPGVRGQQPQGGQPQTQPGTRGFQPQVTPGRPQPEARGQQPQVAQPQAQPGTRGPQSAARPTQAQPEIRGQQPPAQPQSQLRPSQPQPETRGLSPQMRQPQLEQRQPTPQPQVRQAQPQPQVRQAQPQPQVRQAQPQPQVRQAQPQVRQAPPQPQQRQAPPQPQARPAAPASHPQPEQHGEDKPRG